MRVRWNIWAAVVVILSGATLLSGCVYDPYYQDPYATGYYTPPAPAPVPTYPYYRPYRPYYPYYGYPYRRY